MFPDVLPYYQYLGYAMKLTVQITSVIQMSIVVDGWVICTWLGLAECMFH